MTMNQSIKEPRICSGLTANWPICSIWICLFSINSSRPKIKLIRATMEAHWSSWIVFMREQHQDPLFPNAIRWLLLTEWDMKPSPKFCILFSMDTNLLRQNHRTPTLKIFPKCACHGSLSQEDIFTDLLFTPLLLIRRSLMPKLPITYQMSKSQISIV